MSQGIFIVIEGIDGTGKSTQVRLLAEWFAAQGREGIASREPTDGPWGKKLRDSAASGRLAPTEELEYFLKDRRQHVEELIAPALAAGKVVILDRYYFSTMAYQGARGFDPTEIRRLNEEFAPLPDLLLILDLEVSAAHQRIGARGDATNEFEQREALERCRQIFLSLKDEPFARVIPCNDSIAAVAALLQQAVRQAGLAPPISDILRLGGFAVGDELAGEEAERGGVIDRVGEDGQVAVEIRDLPVALFKSQLTGDGGAGGREQGQLDLRHARSLPPTAAAASESASLLFIRPAETP